MDQKYTLLSGSNQNKDQTNKTEMKGQMVYKVPKKMKKRKQLDALVDTVKLPRNSKSNGSMQELLDSDSSEIEEFSRSPYSKRKNRCCAWQSIAAQIGLFMVTTACLTTCIGLVWVQWHIRHELDSLRTQVNSVENSDKTQTLLSQLTDINTSVTILKTGPGSLQEMATIISNIQAKLKELESTQKSLQESVSTATTMLDLPNKVETLSRTLAAAGSDIKLLKNSPAVTNADLENRIAALESKVKNTSSSPSSSLKELEMHFNESLTTNFQSLRQMLDQQSTRIAVLEEFTKSPHTMTEADTKGVTELVTKLVEEKIASLTGDGGTLSSSTNASQAFLAIRLVERGEFLAFKADMIGNFEQINKTVDSLNEELDNIADRLEGHDKAFINLTSAVSSMKIGPTELPESNETAETEISPTASSPTSDLSDTKHAIPSQESGTGTNNVSTVINIDGINSREDLHSAFQSWKLVDGQLAADKLKNINKDKLAKYDKDKNGLFTEDELADALDLPHTPR